MGETKVCAQCGESKPYAAFGPNEKKPQGYFARCYDCRIANGSGVAHTGRGAPKEKRTTMDELKPLDIRCNHTWRLCGDAAVLKVFPNFYADYDLPGDGQEWQVCRDCGDAKLVQVYEPMGEKGHNVALAFRAPITPRDHLVATASVAYANQNGHTQAAEQETWPKPAVVDMEKMMEGAPGELSQEQSERFGEYLRSHTPAELVAMHPPVWLNPPERFDLVPSAAEPGGSGEPQTTREPAAMESELSRAIHQAAVAEAGRLAAEERVVVLEMRVKELERHLRFRDLCHECDLLSATLAKREKERDELAVELGVN